jgi:hypothetical protein
VRAAAKAKAAEETKETAKHEIPPMGNYSRHNNGVHDASQQENAPFSNPQAS